MVIDKHIRRLAGIVDTLHIIEKGRVVWSGLSREIRADENVVHRFLSL